MRPSLSEFNQELDGFCRQLPACKGPECRATWEALRQTSLPFVPILFRDDLGLAYRLSAAVLRAVGARNVGFGYALENHLFILGGLETYLNFRPVPALRAALDQILMDRHYVANTRAYVHGERAFTEGLSARRQESGFVLDGCASFLSLATMADRLFVLLEGKEPLALLFPAAQPSLERGEIYFPDLLVDSDTRPLRCSRTAIPAQAALPVPPDDLAAAGPFNLLLLAWHLALSVGQFCGGASRLADEAKHFAHQFRAFDNRPLDRLDGIILELGQLGVRLGTIDALMASCAETISAVQAGDAGACRGLLLRAQIANCMGMELAEEVARRTRRILGTRLFTPPQAGLLRIANDLLAGPLVPRTNAMLERDIGLAVISG